MAIFVGNKLVDNSNGLNVKEVKHLTSKIYPDPEIHFTVANDITVTQAHIALTSYVGGTKVVFSIKRGSTYISTVETINSFSISLQSGDEVMILGRINILNISSSVHISYLSIQHHPYIDKVFVTYQTTLTEAHLDHNPSLDIVDLRGTTSYGNLSTLTIDDNPNLAKLYVLYNKLTTIDMSTCRPLMYHAYINNNQLTWAGVTFPSTGFSSMLDISANPLGTLDLTGLTNLGRLRAWGTGISAIDFSTTPNTTSIRIDNNSLTTIDTSNLNGLWFLRCHNNPITSLDFTNNPNLTTLACTYTKIPTLDFTHNPLIASVEYIGGGTTGRYLSTIIFGSTNNISQIRVDGNLLSTNQINYILTEVDANGITNGTECRLDAQSPAAPPSSGPPDGITAKANLIAKGWTDVITD